VELKKGLDDHLVGYVKDALEGGFAAANTLAYSYMKGDILPKNPKKAEQLYQWLADRGYTPAQINLANAFYKGEVLKQDFYKALFLYTKASKSEEASMANFAKRRVEEIESKMTATGRRKRSQISSGEKAGIVAESEAMAGAGAGTGASAKALTEAVAPVIMYAMHLHEADIKQEAQANSGPK